MWAVNAIVPLLMSGCLARPISLPVSELQNIGIIRVVAMEAPPLEVEPDLLEERMPVYGVYRNMALPIYAKKGFYRLPGGILIAGQLGEGDTVEEVRFSGSDKPEGRLFSDAHGAWMPTLALSQEAVSQLNAMQFHAAADPNIVRLPLAAKQRNTHIFYWRDAIERWHEQNTPGSDALRTGDVAADAVLYVGIGHYKIYGGQLAFKVLIKLVDREQNRVIARAEEEYRGYEAPAPALLAEGGNKLKSLIRKRGAMLIARAFQAIGLMQANVSGSAAQRRNEAAFMDGTAAVRRAIDPGG
ncbi:MAG: hypothetical protein ACU833_11955 [Gammaproteobacteria bacterium]